MTNNRWWPVLGLTAVALALTGCGSGGSSSDANVRIANATLTHPNIDLLVNGTSTFTSQAFDTVSGYATPGSGSVTLQINDTSSQAALNTLAPTLTGGAHYTVVAYESSGIVKTAILPEDTAAPTSGVTLRVYDAAIEAGKLDVYITSTVQQPCSQANLASISPVTNFALLTAPAAASITQAAGTFTMCVTGSGSKTDLRMNLPLSLTNATVATVMLTPASGGSLLNGSLVVQQGAYSAARNATTRVRLAASLGSPETVSAVSGTQVTVNGGTVSPFLDFSYTAVPYTDSVNVSVNGNSVAVPAGSLPRGGDVTLLVYPGTSGPAVSVISDDNRVPTDQTTAKLRLIDGLAAGSGNLTLTANNTPVGINVAPGTAYSTYSVIPGSSTTSSFTVNFAATTSTLGPVTLTAGSAAQTLNVGGTNTVFAVPDASGAVTLLVR